MDEVTVRYFGWSTISIETADGTLFFDPFFRKYCGAQWFSLPDFQHASFIAATHGHEEHFLDIPDVAKATGAVVIGPPAVERFLMSRCKLLPKHLRGISPWETIELKGFHITAFLWKHRDINLWKALTKAVFFFNTTQLKWAFSSAVSAPFYAPFTGYHVRLPDGLTIMNYNEGFNTKMTDEEIGTLAAKLHTNVLLAGMQVDFTEDIARGVRALKPDITVLYPAHEKFHEMMGVKSRPWAEFASAAQNAHPVGKVIVADPGTAVDLPSGKVSRFVSLVKAAD